MSSTFLSSTIARLPFLSQTFGSRSTRTDSFDSERVEAVTDGQEVMRDEAIEIEHGVRRNSVKSAADDPADVASDSTVFCACKSVKLEIHGECIFSGFCHCSLCRYTLRLYASLLIPAFDEPRTASSACANSHFLKHAGARKATGAPMYYGVTYARSAVTIHNEESTVSSSALVLFILCRDDWLNLYL